MSINSYILEYGDAELERQRVVIKRLCALNAELLEALHVIANAADLEVAQSIACSAIAIAIVKE
jgi:hypothetical protein